MLRRAASLYCNGADDLLYTVAFSGISFAGEQPGPLRRNTGRFGIAGYWRGLSVLYQRFS